MASLFVQFPQSCLGKHIKILKESLTVHIIKHQTDATTHPGRTFNILF